MSLTASEQETARAVLDVLAQERYKGKMYLFLQPLNIAEVPGYFDVVPHQRFLDLYTVTSSLDSYSSMSEFWRDLQGIFENAIAYHQERESKWIAKMARDMLKVVKKEKQKRDGGQSQPTADASSPDVSERKKPFSFKIKLSSKQSDPTANAPASATEMGSLAMAAPVPVASSETISIKSDDKKAVKAKPTQPKLKLKLTLGNKLKKDPMPADNAAATGNPTEMGSQAPPAAASLKQSTTSKPKISLKLGGAGSNSRGKELPKGVSVTSAVAAPSPAKKQKKPKPPAPTTSSTVSIGKPVKNSGSFPVAQALKVLTGLRRRGQDKSVAWFLTPVSDKNILPDYKAKVKYPSDIGTMTSKIEKGSYSSVAAFVLDLRRIFGNCLVYNISLKDSLRSVGVENMQTSEELLKVFFKEYPGSYPPLLHCWKLCIGVLDTLYNLTNPNDGQSTALYFQYPVSYYCGGQFPPDYHEKVSKPMDFGTITSKLMEAKYGAVEDFCTDCRLVISNCINYYDGRPDGVIYIEQANRLNELLSQQIEQLLRYVRSARGASDHARASAPVVLPQPPTN